MKALTRRQIRSNLRYAGPFTVESEGRGLLVQPAWNHERPAACRGAIIRTQWGDCRRCGTPHIAGVFTRIALAGSIQALLRRDFVRRPLIPGITEITATSLANGTIALTLVWRSASRAAANTRGMVAPIRRLLNYEADPLARG